MAHYILEIGTEEMPARFFPALDDYLSGEFSRLLSESMVRFGEIEVRSTPRRMVVSVPDMAEMQDSEEVEVMGPPARIAFDGDGNPTRAGEGFARSQNVAMEDVFVKENDKGEYLAVRKVVGGAGTAEILPEICVKIVSRMPFPKKMHWDGKEFTFGRPLRWIVSLLDDTVVPFTVGRLTAGRETRGHRVMGPGPFVCEHADSFFSLLRDSGGVISDAAERKRIIRERGDALAAEKGGTVAWMDGLLNQVAYLVEYPKPILGRFDDKFLELPREVLLTSMESHQKSFGLEDPQGELLPYFLTILNLDPEETGLVRKGWERVLRARLEDARFFWEADSRTSLDTWLEKLEKVIYIGPLGTMGDKSRRLERLAGFLAERICPDRKDDLTRAGRLAKADLVSEMVGEFDDLQGIMGGIYARNKGESETVATAVYQQYLPTGQDSPVPDSVEGAVLALADKLDNLAGCFGLNMVPTGAADPYALRRQALGIARIVLDHGFRIDLREMLTEAIACYGDVAWKTEPEQSLEKLMDFFAGRLKAYWSAKGVGTKVLDAALGAGVSDIAALKLRLDALSEFSGQDDFEQAVLTFKRADNIIRKQGEQAGDVLDGRFDTGLLQEDPEKALAREIEGLVPRWEALWRKDDYAGLLGLLRELRPVVDSFFDHVMVMCDDPDLRRNRLNMLQALVSRLSGLADFSALQV
jgi:glycyl-tRNA synthetase beta chain